MNAIPLESLPPDVAALIKTGKPIAITSGPRTVAMVRPKVQPIRRPQQTPASEMMDPFTTGQPVVNNVGFDAVATPRSEVKRTRPSRSPARRRIAALEWLEKHAPKAPLALGAVDQFIADRRADR